MSSIDPNAVCVASHSLCPTPPATSPTNAMLANIANGVIIFSSATEHTLSYVNKAIIWNALAVIYLIELNKSSMQQWIVVALCDNWSALLISKDFLQLKPA